MDGIHCLLSLLSTTGEARRGPYSHRGCLNCKMTLSYRFLSKYLNIGQYKVFETDLTVRVRDLTKSTPRHAIYLRSNFDLLIVFVAVYLRHIEKYIFSIVPSMTNSSSHSD